jgi:cell division protein FtsN
VYGPAGPYTYDKELKNNRVEVIEKSPETHKDPRPLPELHPGTYVLQIAAYRTMADADRERAKVNMIGVEAKIQTVTVNEQTLYRVRVGPFKSLDELNRIRSRLRSAEIEATQTRLSD